MADYGPPVDQLLRIGDDLRYEKSHDYPAMGIGLEHVPDLARMAVDPQWDEMPPTSPEVWGPIHAWRALGQLRAERGIPALVGILADQDDEDFNDWICEEIPPVLGEIGPAAIPELAALLERESAGEYARNDASRSLAEVGKRHPEARDEVVAILSRTLERAGENDPTLNGMIVSDLIDLKAREAAGVIERAYAEETVDDSIAGTWHDVWHSLELEGEPPPKTEQRYSVFGPVSSSPNPLSEIQTLLGKLEERSSAGRRAPADRKARNKARQKIEKKVKGKGRKGR
jgi:hypothetical protein